MAVIAYTDHTLTRESLDQPPAEILPAPLVKPGRHPATCEDILLALTGQTENSLIVVPGARYEEVNSFIIACLHEVSDSQETFLIAATDEDDVYARFEPRGRSTKEEALIDLDPEGRAVRRTFAYSRDLDTLSPHVIVNQTEADVYFDPTDEDAAFALSHATSTEEIENLTQALAVLFDDEFKDVGMVDFMSESENYPARWRATTAQYADTRLPTVPASILDHMLRVMDPTGHEYEYNDGPIRRRSGYTRYSQSMTVYLDDESASATVSLARKAMARKELEEARAKLLAFLEKHHACEDTIASVRLHRAAPAAAAA